MPLHPFPLPQEPCAPASEPLRRFLQVARGAGLRISAAEGIDAARAVDLVGYSDRAVLRDTLGAVLAKTLDEKVLYEETFDRYFQRQEFSRSDPEPSSNASATHDVAQGMGSEGGQALADLLETDDPTDLAMAMETAAREAGVQNIRYFTQKNLYVLNILNRMGLRAVQEQIDALESEGTAEATERALRLEAAVERLWDAGRDFVERALLLYARGETEQLRERLLRSARLSNLRQHDLERMRVLVRRIAKRLATRYARVQRRRQRGHLDIRHTLRRNMGWGGIPFLTAWKHKRIEKPRVMVLCDVSGSVAWVSQFLLMFVYSLTEVLADIRSFAYSDSLIEVSETFEQQPFEEAIARVASSMGFGSSNYGSALADFERGWVKDVTNKTTVIILGDARGNGTDPRADIFERLSKRAKRVIWLNPEFRSSWGTGDSDIYRYAPYCSLVRVCSTLNDLERVIGDLLERP
ncbi:MAG TPA: VWA domain-containing protein [Burkholderiales bacterium]|nr:VWA domain-containing protein [Burkholderiales bacterium]